MRGVGLSDPPQPEGRILPPAGRRGTSSSPRDCLGSLTPRRSFHINLTLSQTVRCPAFSPSPPSPS